MTVYAKLSDVQIRKLETKEKTIIVFKYPHKKGDDVFITGETLVAECSISRIKTVQMHRGKYKVDSRKACISWDDPNYFGNGETLYCSEIVNVNVYMKAIKLNVEMEDVL